MIKLLTYNPDERISAKQALRHGYFKEIRQIDRQLRLKAKQQREQQGEKGDDSPATPTTRTGDEDMQPLRDSAQASPTPSSMNDANGYSLPKLGKGSVTHALEGDRHRDSGNSTMGSTTLPTLGKGGMGNSQGPRDDDSDDEDI
jgi:serine/threonine protein kinase